MILVEAAGQKFDAEIENGLVIQVYAASQPHIELRQGEILSGVIQYSYNSDTEEISLETHEYCIVLTQDCDLLRVHDGDRILNEVILLEVQLAEPILARVGGRDIRKPIMQNNNEKYQYLEPVHALADLDQVGIAATLVDFRRYFSVTYEELMRQIGRNPANARRRTVIQSPYREHVQSRFAFYMQRVALPRPHESN